MAKNKNITFPKIGEIIKMLDDIVGRVATLSKMDDAEKDLTGRHMVKVKSSSSLEDMSSVTTPAKKPRLELEEASKAKMEEGKKIKEEDEEAQTVKKEEEGNIEEGTVTKNEKEEIMEKEKMKKKEVDNELKEEEKKEDDEVMKEKEKNYKIKMMENEVELKDKEKKKKEEEKLRKKEKKMKKWKEEDEEEEEEEEEEEKEPYIRTCLIKDKVKIFPKRQCTAKTAGKCWRCKCDFVISQTEIIQVKLIGEATELWMCHCHAEELKHTGSKYKLYNWPQTVEGSSDLKEYPEDNLLGERVQIVRQLFRPARYASICGLKKCHEVFEQGVSEITGVKRFNPELDKFMEKSLFNVEFGLYWICHSHTRVGKR